MQILGINCCFMCGVLCAENGGIIGNQDIQS